MKQILCMALLKWSRTVLRSHCDPLDHIKIEFQEIM